MGHPTEAKPHPPEKTSPWTVGGAFFLGPGEGGGTSIWTWAKQKSTGHSLRRPQPPRGGGKLPNDFVLAISTRRGTKQNRIERRPTSPRTLGS